MIRHTMCTFGATASRWFCVLCVSAFVFVPTAFATAPTLQPKDWAGNESTISTQTLAGSGAYELVATVQLDQVKDVYIVGTLGTAALTGFEITAAANVGGTHTPLLVDADFNTATTTCYAATNNIYTLASGNNFYLRLNLAGVHEIKIYAKSSGAATLSFQLGK